MKYVVSMLLHNFHFHLLTHKSHGKRSLPSPSAIPHHVFLCLASQVNQQLKHNLSQSVLLMCVHTHTHLAVLFVVWHQSDKIYYIFMCMINLASCMHCYTYICEVLQWWIRSATTKKPFYYIFLRSLFFVAIGSVNYINAL